MEELGRTLVTLGGVFLLGLGTDAIGRRVGLPRVSLLLAFGFAIFEFAGPVMTRLAVRRVAGGES